MTTYRLIPPLTGGHPCRGELVTADGRTGGLDALAGLGDGPVLVTVWPDGVVTVDTDRADAPRLPDTLDALTDDTGSYTPDTDPDLIRQARAYGWELVTGASGQYGYRGPVMHPSEYIGGGLADRILGADDDAPHATWWGAVVVESDGEEDGERDADGWALAYREVTA